MKLKRINESFDSPQFKISRYETDINDALKEFEDAYSQEKITAETYAKLLKDIYSVIENSDLDVKGLGESYERDVNLVAEMLKVSGLLSVEKLGEKDWIEFDFGEERRFDTGRKFIQFDAIGETKRLKGRVEVTDDGRYDVKINYGSEAKCDSADEIARFIAGEFGVVLNESLNEDTQLKIFDDDMINDIDILYQWRPEEVEKILVKHGANPNNDTWTAGLDLPAAYDEIMSTFRDKYSDDDEIDYDAARVLGLVEESLNEHRLNSLRQANVDAIEYFMEFEYIYHFPDGKFLATSWKDLKDGVVMGIDDDIEVAQGIMSYLQKEIDFNNKHKEIYDDDPQAELTLEVYNNVKRAYEKEISKHEFISEGTNLKRIASRGEFDNGHILHSDWKEMTEKDAQEFAKKLSIENPKDVYYVAYDDIMNPCADNVWVDGKSYKSEDVTLTPDGPAIKE